MSEQIVDATGNSYGLEIDSKNRAATFSVTQGEESNAAIEGNSYNINTGIINLTSASKSATVYVKNTGDNDLVIPSIFYLIGNSTGGSGDMLWTVLRNPSTGTIVSGATAVEMPGVNRNFGSNKTLSADIYVGAEANTFTNGDKVIESIINQSATRAALGVGSIIIPKGSSIGVDVTPATGNTSVNIEVAFSIYERV